MTIEKSNLYGLVLTGGKSSRMGIDKGTLCYHGKTQVDHGVELLSPFCDQVYVSCRDDQALLDHLAGTPKIIDKFDIKGPMNGILSALKEHSHKYWLVIAIDLPFLTSELLAELTAKVNLDKIATCFENPEKGWPEPLCTIYSPQAVVEIEAYLQDGKKCPRKLLMEKDVEQLSISSSTPLRNINTTEEFNVAKSELSGD